MTSPATSPVTSPAPAKLGPASTLVSEYEANLRFQDRADATVEKYLRTVNEMLAITQTHPLKITRETLYLWDGQLSNRKLDQNSKSNYRSAMRNFLKWLAKEYNVVDLSDDLPVIRQRVSDPLVLHPDDLTHILHNGSKPDSTGHENPIHLRDVAIVTLLAGTGIRLSECVALNFGSIARRRVTSGKDKQTMFSVRVETAKRGRVNIRTVNFGDPDDPADVVTRHFGLWFMDKIRQIGTYYEARNFPLFADATDPMKRLVPGTIEQRVTAVLKRSGRPDLIKHITPHSFRHFYATWRKAAGGDIFVLQRDLGHSQIMTTERYIHLAEKATGEQALKFSPLLNVKAKPLAADIPKDQFAQIVKILIPESSE